jgi:hypothetical protein
VFLTADNEIDSHYRLERRLQMSCNVKFSQSRANAAASAKSGPFPVSADFEKSVLDQVPADRQARPR